MIKKRKRIVCLYGASKLIAKELGVSDVAVSQALNFITNSILADDIRKIALKKYKGVLVEFPANKKKSNKSIKK